MDLIYADETRKDIGVLKSYSLDMAYGSDENDFTCSIDRRDHCCSEGYFIYVEGEEYGGIVDSIRVNTESDEIQYKGRTWHGILESKVVCPEPGDDFLVLSGEANEVLQEIIDRTDLSSLFKASEEDSDIEIASYQMDRYCYGYSGIRKMLKAFCAKLKLYWSNGMIILSAEPQYDYSQDEEFDASQVDFTLQKNFRAVNHMICLGQGDLKDRAVIHIFTDLYGGVQQYLRDGITEPVKDDDYILDTSKQVLFGQDDRAEIYDVPNAEITTNYVVLTSRPPDWDTNCEAYFQYEPKIEIVDDEEVDTGGSYKEAAMVAVKYLLQKKEPYDWSDNFGSYFTYNEEKDKYSNVSGNTVYQKLTSRPGNWKEDYGEYYRLNDGKYEAVQGVTSARYTKQRKQPSDWKKNYGEYYYYYNDGTAAEYKQISGVSYDTYDRQTSKPTDWSTQYGSYYRRATAKELKKNKKKKWYNVTKTSKNKVPEWKAKKYYTKHSHEKAPAWSKGTKYTKTETVSAPAWAADTYYIKKNDTAPAWAAGTYYSSTDLKVAPEWIEGKYFLQVLDRYAVIVSEALDKLAEYHASDELDIDLEETEQTYDVGDIVGTMEQITGMNAIQEVVKKIIKIQNDDIVITYEVG